MSYSKRAQMSIAGGKKTKTERRGKAKREMLESVENRGEKRNQWLRLFGSRRPLQTHTNNSGRRREKEWEHNKTTRELEMGMGLR